MRITHTKRVQLYDDATGYWAEYNWNASEKVWHCRDGGASEGFFFKFLDVPRTMTEHQMLLLSIKNSNST
jgi:hypothetical protein